MYGVSVWNTDLCLEVGVTREREQERERERERARERERVREYKKNEK